MEKYINEIKKALNNNVKTIELISKTNNYVFKVITQDEQTLYAKFYLKKSIHIDHELIIYDLLDHKYLKQLVVFSDNPKYAIFKEIKGKTLDELSQKELNIYKEKIVNSIITFYETIGNKKIDGYGLLDENMKGTSNSFNKFIMQRQESTQDILKEYDILNNAFTKIYAKYNHLITSDNSLVPIDTNAKNIMITENGEVVFIDPGELISGPILMGYGDAVAQIYKTKIYDLFIKKLKPSKEDLIRIRIYAIFSSLNILAFLKENGIGNLQDIIPYGNQYTFYELIKEHLKELGI